MIMSDSRETNPVYYTLILTALTAVLAYFINEPPLESSRPKVDQPPTKHVAWGNQQVLARLWEDPLTTEKTGVSNAISASALGEQIRQHLLDPAKSNLRILCVSIEGFPYPEDREVRLRLRYAVQRALADAGSGSTLRGALRPEDRSHIGLMEVAWPDTALLFTNGYGNLTQLKIPKHQDGVSALTTNGEPKWQNLYIPFEWFEPTDQNSRQAVLLLWMKEEAFADYPLQRLYLLARQMGATQNPPFAIVGPRSSNTLAAGARGTDCEYETDTNYVK